MRSAIVLSLLVVVAAACTGSMSSSETPTPSVGLAPSPSVPDGSLGLSKGSVFDVPTPPAVKPNETAPGEQPALARPYVIAPPRVPHAVADFLPITSKDNACIGCHAVKEKKSGEPTPIPASHYTDYRSAPDRVGNEVVGARYVCTSCHASTTDAPALVDNRFRP